MKDLFSLAEDVMDGAPLWFTIDGKDGDFHFALSLRSARLLLHQLHEHLASLEETGEALSVTPQFP